MKKSHLFLALCTFGCTNTTIVNTGTISTGRIIYDVKPEAPQSTPVAQPIIVPKHQSPSEVKRVIVKKGCGEFHIPTYGPEPKLPLDIKDIMVKNPSKGLELLTNHIHNQSVYIADVKARVASETKAHLRSCK